LYGSWGLLFKKIGILEYNALLMGDCQDWGSGIRGWGLGITLDKFAIALQIYQPANPVDVLVLAFAKY